MKTILITGDTGFIGQKLSKRLADEGFQIHGLSRRNGGDITNFNNVREYLNNINPHFIIHLAARTEVEKSFYDPIDYQMTNYNATVNLIECAKELSNLELFVFASTMETYGAVPKLQWKPFTENTHQYPNAPYAVAKIACEYYLRYAERAYNFPFCVLRQTNTYGREDNDFFVVEQFITQMLKNPEEVNFGYREPYRNFLYIDDLIDLYVKIVKNVDLSRGEFFCTGPANAIQIGELAAMIAEKLHWHGKINWGTKPKRVGEIYYLNSTSEKAENILNWKPKVGLSEGLDKTIEIWKRNYQLSTPTSSSH